MHNRLKAASTTALVRWVLGVERNARRVVLAVSLATVAALIYAVTSLGINANTLEMVAPEVPSRQLLEEFSQIFPILDDAVMVVVKGETPELTREAALQLDERLKAEPERYENVFTPGVGEFFERNGLLYLTLDELYQFSDQMAELQPLIAELERDPSLPTLAELLEEARSEERLLTGDAEGPWTELLERLATSTESVHSQVHPREVPWETLLLEGTELAVGSLAIVILELRVDKESFLDTRRALAQLRGTFEEMGLTAERGIEIRLSGHGPIAQEEIMGFLWDIGVGGLACFVLVAGVLYLAFHAWPLVFASLITLVVGLVWTAAAAALLVGKLSIISLSFAILAIGLGIDFAIHLGMAYASLRYANLGHRDALAEAVGRVGWPLVICTVTTSIGFYVFVPTPFLAMSELGMIAGTGMGVILFLTVTLLPALLSTGFPLTVTPEHRPLEISERFTGVITPNHRLIRWGALAAALGALALVPQVNTEPMVMNLRDQSTPSVEAFFDLLALENELSPLFADALAPDLESAEALGAELEGLPTVARIVTLASFVPEEQEEKRAILEDVAFLLEGGIPLDPDQPIHGAEERRDAVRSVIAVLEEEAERQSLAPLAEEMRNLARVLATFLDDAEARGTLDASLATLERITLAPLPRQLEKLRTALEPGEVAIETLPQEIVDRQVAADGRVRVTAFPAEDMSVHGELARFVETVQSIAPDATGMAPNLMGFADTTLTAFRQALVCAFLAIAGLLGILWLRWKEPMLALTPLVLGALLTCAGMVIFDMPLTFGNVLVVPLLLGAGVDSGIHLVQTAASGERGDNLLSSTSARAVLYSAVTTITSFGALGLSSHAGMASIGNTLTLGMLCMLFANLVVLPALLTRWPPPAPAS